MQTTNSVINELKETLNAIYLHLKELAPDNSSYRGLESFKPVNFIFVNNKRVYTNTGNLKRSIKSRIKDNRAKMVHDVYLSGASVPYYERAVLSKTITRARHYGRLEYGGVRYTNDIAWKSSLEEEVENRNYMYYEKGKEFIRLELSKYNGRKIYVSDDIGVWKNGI